MAERKYKIARRGGKGYEVIKRGTLKALLRDPVVQDPTAGIEEEEELDELEDELEDDDMLEEGTEHGE